MMWITASSGRVAGGATIFSLDDERIAEVEYAETNHYKLTRDFLECPERYFRHLFAEPEDTD